jgi:hypothetical protein
VVLASEKRKGSKTSQGEGFLIEPRLSLSRMRDDCCRPRYGTGVGLTCSGRALLIVIVTVIVNFHIVKSNKSHCEAMLFLLQNQVKQINRCRAIPQLHAAP